jgi:hypothetical protein
MSELTSLYSPKPLTNRDPSGLLKVSNPIMIPKILPDGIQMGKQGYLEPVFKKIHLGRKLLGPI